MTDSNNPASQSPIIYLSDSMFIHH